MSNRKQKGQYELREKNENFAIIECIYTCPHCKAETGTYLTIYPDGFDLIENGSFFEPLTCTSCGETTDVIF